MTATTTLSTTPSTRRALVTGASRGIGEATARRLRDDGARVVGVRYRSAPPEGVADQWLREDLADPGSAARIAAAVHSGGMLDAVVLAAGVSIRSGFADGGSDAGVDPLGAQIELDLVAPLALVRALVRCDALSASASVVFVGSNLARRGLAGKVAYAAAKAGLEGATRALAAELGPGGVRVNTVAPGLVRTDMTEALGDAGFEAYAREVPLRRAGTPADIANVIAFLNSSDAAYVTGQVIDVDGGWSVSTSN